MSRYAGIQAASFGSTALPLPISLRLARKAEPLRAAGDNDGFETSLQLGPASLTAELRIRGTATAEALAVGSQNTISVTIAPSTGTQAARTVTLAGAVLLAVELNYEQGKTASATLRFAAEAPNGNVDPFSAEDVE